jgi:hypothetical protein
MPDVRLVGFHNKRVLVSRKRTRNLFDLTSLWKKTVLTSIDQDASNPMEQTIALHGLDSDESSDEGRWEDMINTFGY